MSFRDDIQGQNTQLYPIVVIELGEVGLIGNVMPDYIFLSTNNSTISIYHESLADLLPDSTRHCKPLLLNIPSIKESVDIESKKFKISNVSLDISNYEYEGKRFTDILSESSLINVPVSIYFKSPSTTWVSSEYVADNYLDTLCPLVYQGVIRRISHDDEKVKVELEDLTEQKAHKDLPSESVPDDESILDKARNKVKPMVYGEVDRSPLIMIQDGEFIADYKEIEGEVESSDVFGDENSALNISQDSLYINVKKEGQFTYEDGKFFLNPNNAKIFALIDPEDGVINVAIEGENILECKDISKKYSVNLSNSIHSPDSVLGDFIESGDIKKVNDNSYDMNQIHFEGESNFDADYSATDIGVRNIEQLSLKMSLSYIPVYDHIENTLVINKVAINGLDISDILITGEHNQYAFPLLSNEIPALESIGGDDIWQVSEDSYEQANDITTGSGGLYDNFNTLFNFTNIDNNIESALNVDFQPSSDTLDNHSLLLRTNIILFYYGYYGNLAIDFRSLYRIIGLDAPPTNEVRINTLFSLTGNLSEIDISRDIDASKIFSKDFYANVEGRVNTFDDHPNNLVSYSAMSKGLMLYEDIIRANMLGWDVSEENQEVVDGFIQDIHDRAEVWENEDIWNQQPTWIFEEGILCPQHQEYHLSSYMPTIGIIYAWEEHGLPNYDNELWHYEWTSNNEEQFYAPFPTYLEMLVNNSGGLLNVPGDMFENPIDIIYDLVRSELDHHNINLEEYAEAKIAHAGWEFGFTVNKKISSKKLLQEIFQSTKSFPKFNNDGTFGFSTIKNAYTAPDAENPDGSSDYEKATLIKESEVLSYSFKKTKPEQIYKRVDVQYRKDYAQDSYLKRTDALVTGAYTGEDDDAGDEIWEDAYYGIENSKDSYLEFESDYIRKEDTADLLASFLSFQYSNDHLIFNLKLPLQYIDNLEIGSLVKFRELLGGKAFGIDYRIVQNPTKIGDESNTGQYYYPLFMVTSTAKNLDSVSIECVQLHQLSIAYLPDDSEWMQYDEGQAFYFPEIKPIIPDAEGEPGEPTWGEDIHLDGIIFESTFEAPNDDHTIPAHFTLGVADTSDNGTEYNYGPLINQSVFYTISYGLEIPAPEIGTPNIVGVHHIWDETSGSFKNKFAFFFMQEVDTTGTGSVDRMEYFNTGLEFIPGDSLELVITPYQPDFADIAIGDANQDGNVNVLDIVEMRNYIFGDESENFSFTAADVNADDSVNILDIIETVNIIIGD